MRDTRFFLGAMSKLYRDACEEKKLSVVNSNHGETWQAVLKQDLISRAEDMEEEVKADGL